MDTWIVSSAYKSFVFEAHE